MTQENTVFATHSELMTSKIVSVLGREKAPILLWQNR